MRAWQPAVYEGLEHYAFVSYCHRDEDSVFPIIERLTESGLRLWYDAGIDPGTEWPEVIANHLENSAAFIAFVSEQALISHNCRREFNYAMMENKPSLIILLEDVDMTPVMKMQLSTIQALYCSEFAGVEQLVSVVVHSQPVMSCVDEWVLSGESKGRPDASTQDGDLSVIGKGSEGYYLIRESDGKRIDITHDRFSIGRKKDSCDYVLSDPAVSRVHAFFHLADGNLYIIDNNSLNQTYVNGQAIKAACTTQVALSDRIEIADTVFTVHMEDET